MLAEVTRRDPTVLGGLWPPRKHAYGRLAYGLGTGANLSRKVA